MWRNWRRRVSASRRTLHSPATASEEVFYLRVELLGTPLLFLRRWLGTVLVGTLRESALLFVWDQLAMQYWDW